MGRGGSLSSSTFNTTLHVSIMKLLLVAAAVSTASSFAPPSNFGRSRTSTSLNTSADEAISAALEASKKFGASSPEAKVLWDVVEEINSSDNRIAYKSPQAPIVDDDYESKVLALSKMISKTTEELNAVKKMADELKGVKLASPPSGSPPPLSPENNAALNDALAAAQAASDQFGKESSEATLAWETVEEIAASANDDEATRLPLDEECLIELIDGCEALEKFKSVLEERVELGAIAKAS